MYLLKAVAALAAALFLLASCGGGDYTPQNGNLVSAEFDGNYSGSNETEVMQAYDQAMLADGMNNYTVAGTLGGYDTMSYTENNASLQDIKSLWDIWDLVKDAIVTTGLVKYWALHKKVINIDSYKIVYTAGGREGAPVLSGRMFVPRYLRFSQPELPILLFTHPTETQRSESPSGNKRFDGTFTKPFGSLFALFGFVVIMPDYPGLGENNETHPYCIAGQLGETSAYMVDAVLASKKFNYNGETNIIGYSEGGYAAFATAKYMLEHSERKQGYSINKVASLAGPYDLNDTMKSLMLSAGLKYPAPYFLPYTINGYRAAYPAIDYLEFNRSVVSTPVIDGITFYNQLYPMLYGDYSGTQISEKIYRVKPDSNQTHYYGPISVTTTEFQMKLNEANSSLNSALTDNTLVDPNWYPGPNTQFYFNHFNGDDCVPQENTLAMQNAIGGYSNVHIEIFKNTFPVPYAATGSYHASAIVQAYLRGLCWMLGWQCSFVAEESNSEQHQ